jgi:hypothetical protein
VAIQTDGKLVVVGETYRNNDSSSEDFAVARHNIDGTVDAAFGKRDRVRTDFPGLAAIPSAVAIQADGKIVVAGRALPLFTFAGNFEVARYVVRFWWNRNYVFRLGELCVRRGVAIGREDHCRRDPFRGLQPG